jgi:protein-L-isoaspartate(D-aspartate) O-methyltransferase
MITMTPDDTAGRLHERMVQEIIGSGSARTGPVIAALRAVSRHAFLPGVPLSQACDPHVAVITKKAPDGTHLSCASVATLVAGMLEALQVRPGDRVYECGAGTGYNAALLAELAGPHGRVTTADIDADVTADATAALRAAGYGAVRVLTRDGALGAPEDAPFDRIIATVGIWDIPAAWFTQLTPGGRMVLPLRWRGQTRGVAFTKDHDGALRSESVFLCGFVPIIGQDGERTATIHPDPPVRIHYDIDQAIDPAELDEIFQTPEASAWSGVVIRTDEPVDGIWLRATATDPAVCRIEATPAAAEAGICNPAIKNLSPALIDRSSLAYLTYRRLDGPQPRIELGATAHGPHGQALADRLRDHILTWNANRNAQPTITAVPLASAGHGKPSAGTIVKKDCAITVTYQAAARGLLDAGDGGRARRPVLLRGLCRDHRDQSAPARHSARRALNARP